MTWRSRLILVIGSTAFGAATLAARPYWDSAFRSEDSLRGRAARAQRANDTPHAAATRAATGGAIGFACGLLSFTLRDYRRNDRRRRLHWTGLEIRDK